MDASRGAERSCCLGLNIQQNLDGWRTGGGGGVLKNNPAIVRERIATWGVDGNQGVPRLVVGCQLPALSRLYH